MKKLLLNFFGLALILLAFQSCDKCKDISCENGGTCEEGKCTCPTGYSGDNCEIKDPCLGISCLNGGTCATGTCTCPSGYFGGKCEFSCSGCSIFTGDWSTYNQYCNQTTQFNSTISISQTASNKLTISNFNNKGWTVIADVSGSSFTISPQTFTDANTGKSWKVETTSAATINGNNLTIPVKFTDTATLNIINCSLFILYK